MLLLIFHLFFVVVFAGFIFCDVFIISRLPHEQKSHLKQAYFYPSACASALSFLGLLATGILLANAGYAGFSAAAKIFFWSKILTLALMLALTALSVFLSRKFPLHPLVKFSHHLALVLLLLIICLAKLLQLF